MIFALIFCAITLTAGVGLIALLVVDAYNYVKNGEHEYEED